jgi:hypothetical protein
LKEQWRLKMQRIEEKIAIWAFGVTFGALAVMTIDRVTEGPITVEREAARAQELIDMYQRGKKDALRISPISMELEEACLSVWSSKQEVK